MALFAEASKRDGSDYNSLVNENPALRKYYLADRDRTKMGASIDYMATHKLFLSARVDYNQDDYTDSVIGLTEATQPVYTVDFSYHHATISRLMATIPMRPSSPARQAVLPEQQMQTGRLILKIPLTP